MGSPLSKHLPQTSRPQHAGEEGRWNGKERRGVGRKRGVWGGGEEGWGRREGGPCNNHDKTHGLLCQVHTRDPTHPHQGREAQEAVYLTMESGLKFLS